MRCSSPSAQVYSTLQKAKITTLSRGWRKGGECKNSDAVVSESVLLCAWKWIRRLSSSKTRSRMTPPTPNPTRRHKSCIIKITDHCSRRPDVNESSCLSPPLSWNAECCAHRTFLSEPCRARNTLASFRATWLLNKVFPSVAISQRHLAPNPAGQRCA